MTFFDSSLGLDSSLVKLMGREESFTGSPRQRVPVPGFAQAALWRRPLGKGFRPSALPQERSPPRKRAGGSRGFRCLPAPSRPPLELGGRSEVRWPVSFAVEETGGLASPPGPSERRMPAEGGLLHLGVLLAPSRDPWEEASRRRSLPGGD